MTVKKVNEQEKAMIAHMYAYGSTGSDELALKYGVSRRTINRVLVEMGVARTRRVKPKPTPVEQPTPVVVPVAEPAPVQIEMFPEQTFFEKSIALFKRIIAKLFSQTNA
jgi:hypothetical protein